MQLTDPTMPATYKPDAPASKIRPPPSPAVTRQRLSEEDRHHVFTAVDLDSSVIDYVIIDNSIRKNQVLLSMT